MEDQSMRNSMIELVEALNQQPSNDGTLLDCLDKLNIVAANDNANFLRFCGNINVDIIYNIIEKYSSGIGDKRLHAQITKSSCVLLSNIFSNLATVHIIEKYGVYIKNSMNVKCDQFHILCLQQTLRLADEDNFSYFMSNPDLIELAIKFLCDENLEAYSISGKILKKLIALNGNGWLFSDDFIKLFHRLLSKNAVVKFRIYEVFVEYILKYPEYIEACKASKIFDSLIKVLVNGNDILSQLNGLDMASQIAISSPQGLDFIQENGVIGWVSNIFSATDDPMSSFLLPGCVKFFGVLCSANPMEIISQYKHILIKIFEHINSDDDEVMRCLCVETISFICSKSEGLKMLYHESDSLKNAIKVMTKIISNPGEDDYARKKTVQSLAAVFDHDVDDIEVSVICEKLYRHIDDNPIKLLLTLAQKPFVEIRYGSLTLLRNISKYSWVEQDMVLCPMFMEYLLDRCTESEKDGRELKYDIIKNLSVSATALDNFGRDYFEKLGIYSTQGPFYAESHVIVSYEQED